MNKSNSKKLVHVLYVYSPSKGVEILNINSKEKYVDIRFGVISKGNPDITTNASIPPSLVEPLKQLFEKYAKNKNERTYYKNIIKLLHKKGINVHAKIVIFGKTLNSYPRIYIIREKREQKRSISKNKRNRFSSII